MRSAQVVPNNGPPLPQWTELQPAARSHSAKLCRKAESGELGSVTLEVPRQLLRGHAHRLHDLGVQRGHGERARSQLLFKLAGTENMRIWLLTFWLLNFGC